MNEEPQDGERWIRLPEEQEGTPGKAGKEEGNQGVRQLTAKDTPSKREARMSEKHSETNDLQGPRADNTGLAEHIAADSDGKPSTYSFSLPGIGRLVCFDGDQVHHLHRQVRDDVVPPEEPDKFLRWVRVSAIGDLSKYALSKRDNPRVPMVSFSWVERTAESFELRGLMTPADNISDIELSR